MTYWHDGQVFHLAIVVETRRTRMDVLLPGERKVRTLPLEELETMRPVDAGARQVRKARASLRRSKRGASQRYRRAVDQVLAR